MPGHLNCVLSGRNGWALVGNARRVAFLSEHASPVALLGSVDAGGQNVYVDEVSRALGRMGFLVDIFTRWDDPNEPEIRDWAPGVRIINLSAGPREYVGKDDLWPFMPAFLDAALRFICMQCERYDVLHGNFWMSGWVAAEVKERLGIPAVQIFHATGKTKQRYQGTADTSPCQRIAVEERVIRSVDRVIAQCPAEETELIEDYRTPAAKITIIPSAVNTELFRPVDRDLARRRLGLDPDDFIVTYVGRMLPRKDVRNVVRTVGLMARPSDPPLKLLLVGGETSDPDPAATPEIGELQRLAAVEGITDRVIFTGKRQPDVLHLYYGAADVVVTTPWYEPFGLTPLEGMACARPVIGSNVGGIAFTVADGETGYLVPAGDPVALAARLRLLLEQPALGERLGQAARERVEREFTWPTVAQRTAALYDRVLSTSEHSRPTALFPAGHVGDNERSPAHLTGKTTSNEPHPAVSVLSAHTD